MPLRPSGRGAAPSATSSGRATFARKLEFIVIGLLAAAITLAIGAMAASVLLKPLARAGAVLG